MRTHLTTLMALVIILPALASALLLGLGARRYIQRETFRFVDSSADLAENAIEMQLGSYVATMHRYRVRQEWRTELRQALAASPPLRAGLLRTFEQRHLAPLIDSQSGTNGHVVVLDLQGRLLAWAGFDRAQALLSSRRYTPAALQRVRAPMLGDTYLGVACQQATVDVMTPVETVGNPSRVFAVLIWQVHLQAGIAPLLANTEALGETGEWVLVDRNGLALLDLRHSPHSAMHFHVKAEPATRARLGQEVTWVSRDYRGAPVVAAARRIAATGWGLVTKIDRREAFAGMYALTVIWAILMVLMISGGYLLARVAADRITSPILHVSATARRFAEGDLSARVELERDDEVGQLARDFNIMAGRVGATRAELERQVAERTASLQAANEDLRRVNEEMATFTYSVSHDLASPLVSLQGLTGMLLRDYRDRLDAEGQRRLERLRVNVQMMEDLVTDLLELSRVGRVEREAQEVDLAATAAEVVAALQGPQTAAVEWALPQPGQCPRILIEPNRLRQVLSNLVSNALKYGTTAPRPRIEVVCGALDDRFAQVSVRDNGPGIPTEFQERVFAPFQRLPAAVSQPGTGMGLAIVRKIVEHYGGSVWVEPAPQGGATFSFTLPRAGESG